MYEYMHPGFLFLGGLVIFTALFAQILRSGKAQKEGEKIGFPYLMFVAIGIILTIVFSDAYQREERITANTKDFKSNKTLQCSSFTTTYLVSQEKGWSLVNERTLSNDEILLDIDFCKGD
ncbi:hypothetical protein JHD46_05270 [Sulfurimonas sp. SAG-AH-194-C20]|nr:hypothetical protein [Sulfurimonas sp. SAG-AH-194-C20]MDF1879049.1 hypothetical protein [Sulfurimonas sp. SAG-AH-194-C20]